MERWPPGMREERLGPNRGQRRPLGPGRPDGAESDGKGSDGADGRRGRATACNEPGHSGRALCWPTGQQAGMDARRRLAGCQGQGRITGFLCAPGHNAVRTCSPGATEWAGVSGPAAANDGDRTDAGGHPNELAGSGRGCRRGHPAAPEESGGRPQEAVWTKGDWRPAGALTTANMAVGQAGRSQGNRRTRPAMAELTRPRIPYPTRADQNTRDNRALVFQPGCMKSSRGNRGG